MLSRTPGSDLRETPLQFDASALGFGGYHCAARLSMTRVMFDMFRSASTAP